MEKDYKSLYENLSKRVSAMHALAYKINPGDVEFPLDHGYELKRSISQKIKMVAFGRLTAEELRK